LFKEQDLFLFQNFINQESPHSPRPKFECEDFVKVDKN